MTVRRIGSKLYFISADADDRPVLSQENAGSEIYLFDTESTEIWNGFTWSPKPAAAGGGGGGGQRLTAKQIKTQYESNADTNALTDSRLALLQQVADPRRLIGALQWDVNPSILEGRTADDFERTIRLEFEVPYLQLTDYYFEVAAEGFVIHNRSKWAQVTHLDVAISDVIAGDIALNLPAERDHIEIELKLYKDSTVVGASAVTSRRILIVEAAGDAGGSDQDDVARGAASAASAKADANAGRITAIEGRTTDEMIGDIAFSNPPEDLTDSEKESVRSAFDFQETIESIIPPWSEIVLHPGGIGGAEWPKDLYVELSGRLTDREINSLKLTLGGIDFSPHASTPVSGFNTEDRALVRFDISARSNDIANATVGRASFLVVLTFGFVSGDDYVRRINFAVNNPSFPAFPLVMQSAVNGQDGAGVANLVLNSRFAEWKKFSGSAWDGNNDMVVSFSIDTAVIVAQTGTTQDFIITRGAAQANPVILRYTRATRTFSFTGNGSANDRIIYAVLED